MVVICAPEAVPMAVITDFGYPSEPLRWRSIDVQLRSATAMPESRIVLFDINASLSGHVNLSFWFLDFFLAVLSIKSIELIIAKDGIVNLFIGIVRESLFYLGDCQIQLD